jgi:hypothetical protein
MADLFDPLSSASSIAVSVEGNGTWEGLATIDGLDLTV